MAKSKKKKKKKSVTQSVTAVVSEVETVGDEPAASDVVGFNWKSLLNEPVALGLAILIAVRPWRDGMTYPYFNVYFVGYIAVLAVCFLSYMVYRGRAIRSRVPIALFGAFLAVAYGTALSGVNYDVSLRQFLLYTSYLFIFLMASQGLRTRFGIGIVLGTLVVTSLLSAVWALVHAEFVLPFVRESIARQPSLLMQYFGTTTLTPELKHRLEMARAFGTFLHPNALAAFLVLCIPLMTGWAIASASRMKDIVDRDKPTLGWLNSSFATLLVGALAAFFMFFYMYSLNALLLSHTLGAIPLIQGTARSVFYLGILPCAFGLVSGYLVHLKGALGYGRILGTVLLFLTAGMQVYCLWQTYSRAAMLGLMFGCALLALLLFFSTPRIPRLYGFGRRWAELAAILLVVAMTLVPAVHALDLEDDGFMLPDTKVDFRPKGISYDASELRVEGREVGLEEIVSAQSLSFRMTYWRVGMLIVEDNFFTGVGLGNFGTVYGVYQFLDAHDVKTAHNDYLQIFTETGVFGFILFMAFWIYFMVWGASRILKERDWREKFILGGLYAGIVSFLAHTFFDFDFQNPSLAMTLYLLTGIFFARSALVDTNGETAPKVGNLSVPIVRIVAVLGVILAIAVASASLRQFRYDFGWTVGEGLAKANDIGNRFTVDMPGDVLEFLVSAEVQQYKGEGPPPYLEVTKLRTLVGNDEDILAIGMVRVPTGVRTPKGNFATRELADGEAIPGNAGVFVNNAGQARALVMRTTETRLTEFEELEKLYPHGTMVPRLGFRWARAKFKATTDKNKQLRYSQECLAWARKRTERSPYDPEAQIELCAALWARGQADPTPKQLDYFRDGAAVYEKALELYPTSSSMQQQYAESMSVIGNAFLVASKRAKPNTAIAKSLGAEGEVFMRKSRDAYKTRDWLVRYKHDVLNLR
ncbi:MAG: O-antigen ligase family protein [Candidatus Hydrogenedentota bacterium]